MNQDKTNPYQAPTSLLETEATTAIADIVAYRKQLIPLWIKIFGWLFILFGIGVPITAVYSATMAVPMHYTLFGLSAYGSISSPMAIFLMLLFIALAVSAYGLLFGRAWGLMLCLALGYISLAICIATTIIALATQPGINIRLEIVVLIPYLIRLHKIKHKWQAAANAPS